MSPTTTAARPDALLRFAAATGARSWELVHHATTLEVAIRAARRTIADRLPGLGSAAPHVTAHGHRNIEVAHATAAVALAFAGAGGPLLSLALAALRSMTADELAGLVAAALGRPGTGGGAAPTDADPDDVAALAALLGPVELARLAVTHPELVGPVDGMPPAARYAANRSRVADALVAAEAAGDRRRAHALRRLLEPGRQILDFDTVGDGRVTEVFGDLSTAANVAVVVPGMGNDLGNFDRHTASKGRALFEEAGAGTAVIAWLGYDSPEGGSAVLDDAASDGADALRRLVDGLPDDARRTVVGHSYGTVVAAEALRRGLEVDQVVLTGSPGVLEPTAAALAGDVPVWVARAPGDAIGWSENFGRDPSDPRFGATRIDTGDALWHDDYFDVASESLANVGRVVAGRFDEVTVVRPSAVEVAVGTVDDLQSMLDRTDAAQAVLGAEAALVSDAVDGVEPLLPTTIAAALDDVQDRAGMALEVANRSIDLHQRLTSIELWGDVAVDTVDIVHHHADDIADGARELAGEAAEGVRDGARRLGGLLG
jgi:hypothetical protein